MSGVLMLVGARPSGPPAVPGISRRTEYRLVQEALDAETVDLNTVDNSRLGRLAMRLGGKYVALAVLGMVRVLRGRVDLVLCDNENEAMVLAGLLLVARRRVPLVTLGISPGSRKKTSFFLLRPLRDRVDLWLVHASVHADVLVGRHQVPADRVRLLPFHADTLFFDPAAVHVAASERLSPQPYVLAVGRQHRDHEALIAAAADLPVDVVIDAGSLYSRSPDSLTGRALPDTVHLVSLDHRQLRDAYGLAAVVVASTLENDFGAGSTTLLEAMAMARPVVITRAAGSGDLVGDRRAVLRGGTARDTRGLFAPVFAARVPEAQRPHGLHVPVGDVDALRRALRHLLSHPDESAQMGRAGRALVVAGLTTDHYVARVVKAVREVQDRSRDRIADPAAGG